MHRTLIASVVGLGLVSAAPAGAQDEAALKSFFEGRRVTVRIDMPGTSDGVNVYPFRGGEMDLQDYRHNMREYGPSIRAGDSVVVTLVKVKKDLIEFQLAGGGFGTFWDDTSTSPDIPFVEKSGREKELERRVRSEDDAHRRRELQRELDDVRERRERENRRIEKERQLQSEMKARRIAEERARGGSRFNLRFDRDAPANVTPDQVMAALAEYVDFGMSSTAADARDDLRPVGDITALRKGMTRADVEQLFGRAAERSERREGTFAVTTLVYDVGDQRVAVDFIDNVVVRYAITSK